MKIKCKWCGELTDDEKHEEDCNLNDGGKEDMNYEEVANKYF